MSFHVYVEPDLQAKLDAFCKRTGQKRNSLVRQALKEFLERSMEKTWSESLAKFKPDPTLPAFESFRKELLPDRDDVFSD